MPAFVKRAVQEVQRDYAVRRTTWLLTLACGHIVRRQTGPQPVNKFANCPTCGLLGKKP